MIDRASGELAPDAELAGADRMFVGWMSRRRNPTFVLPDVQHRKSKNSGASADDERMSDYAFGLSNLQNRRHVPVAIQSGKAVWMPRACGFRNDELGNEHTDFVLMLTSCDTP
ncbi:MAG: hypothetical protein LBB51_06640 [Zoogloeaceae bacterium]|nr:hypothetical protein [Zoogloeaceae bacterium]